MESEVGVMADSIMRFRGDYMFLSNFYTCTFMYDGHEFENSEAAYQSAKTTSEEDKRKFMFMSPKEAKRFGRKVQVQDGFFDRRIEVMQDVVLCKFMQNPDLMEKLQATGDAKLVEGNMWHDNFWGVCMCGGTKCKGGSNVLGKILMQVRDTYRTNKELCERANERASGLGE